MNVYKMMNKDKDGIKDFDLDKCDHVVRKFGLDKNRAAYFHTSRTYASDVLNRAGLVREEIKQFTKREVLSNFEYKIPSDVLAIKSLVITISKEGLELPLSMKV